MPDNVLFWLQGGVFFALLLAASATDIKSRIIPDSICAAIAFLGTLSFDANKLSGIFCVIPLIVGAVIFGGLGGGDILLMAAAGTVLGMECGLAAMFLGLSAWLLYYVAHRAIAMLRGRKYLRQGYPVAPFLSLGCIVAYIMNQGGIANI